MHQFGSKIKAAFRRHRRRPGDHGASDEPTPAAPTSPPPYAVAKPAPTPRPERFGLILLHDGSAAEPEATPQYPVDIVAVHGLNGDAYTTWTHKSGTLWLQSILPNYLPGSRVYTYGYPSQVFFSNSRATVKNYARNLLDALRGRLEKTDQALVLAKLNEVLYGPLLQSIVGITFLGTPHRGSQVASLGKIVATIMDICFKVSTAGLQSGIVRDDLLKQLENDATSLDDLADNVKNCFDGMAIVSFFETQTLMSKIIVEEASATLGILHEEPIPLYANHRDICRFEGETNDCKAVCEALQRIASQPPRSRHQLGRASTPVSQRSFNERELSCMKLFNPFDMADYRRRLPVPIEGTCQWIRKHPLFLSWFEGFGNALLWLTGHPACGKTMISYSLARQVEASQKNVLFFSCDDQVDAKIILKGLIAQLVQRNPKMVRHVKKVFDVQDPSILSSFSALWSIFERIVNDLEAGPLYVILDSLDECERSSRDDLLNAIRELLIAGAPGTGNSRVRCLLTSRPALGNAYLTKEPLEKYQLPIDQGQPGYEKDIRVFIEKKVDEIAIKRHFSEDVKSDLVRALCARAGQTFLWTHLVIAKIEQSHLASAGDFGDIIDNLPPDLETMYVGFLSSISEQDQPVAWRLLQLLLASSRPLLLEELNVAFTIKPTHDSAEGVGKDCQSDMAGAVLGILGPLVRLADSKVSLIHRTAKDFLLGPKSEGAARTLADRCPGMSVITTKQSALRMASDCIQYLLFKNFARDWYSPSENSQDSGSELSSDSGSTRFRFAGLGFFEDGETDEDGKAGLVIREPGDLEADISLALGSKHAFYNYSSLHWAEHLALCEDEAPSGLLQSARSLVDVETAHCQNWLHFYRSEIAGAADDIHGNPSPVVLAAYLNLRAVLIDILDKDSPSPREKAQALRLGAKAGHSQIVTVLLGANADPNYPTMGKLTALTEAAAHGRTECVTQLLRHEGDGTSVKAEDVATALDLAASNGHHDIVKYLLGWHEEAGADGHLGGTSLIRAARAGHLTIVSTLCKHRAIDVNYRDKKGRSAVSFAAGEGTAEVLKYMLKQKKIDANLADKEGRSPLSYASGNGHADAVRILAKSKKVIDMKKADRDGRSPLSWACEKGHEDAVRALLDHGCSAQVNESDVDGWTPLAWTVHESRPGIIEALIDAGDPDLEKREGSRTVLEWAVEYGHVEVVRMLLRKGCDAESAAHLVPELRATQKGAVANEINMYLNRKV